MFQKLKNGLKSKKLVLPDFMLNVDLVPLYKGFKRAITKLRGWFV